MATVELAVRPGFNLDCTFRDHASAIRFVCCNTQGTNFFSCDDKTVRVWRPSNNAASGQATCKVLHELVFPSYQASFVTAMMCAPEPLNCLLVACLDGHLRIYSEKLRLRSCMPWANGLVRQMVYNSKRDHIVTAGSSGVKSWSCEFDHEACRSDVAMDLHSIPRTKDGEIVPWGLGKYQHARLQTSFNVPGARCINPRFYQPNKNEDGPSPKELTPGAVFANIGSSEWCERILLHEESQTLFAMFMGSIHGFDAGTGAMTMNFANLHPAQIITSMVYAPSSETIFTATLDNAITVWRISGNIPQKFRHLGKLVFLMAGDHADQPKTILTSSYDGLVTLWSAESLEPVHRMRLAQAPWGILCVGSDRAVVHLQNEIKVFTIQHLYDLLLECKSVPLALHKLNAGLVLAEFSDCSVRLIDVNSERMDKSVAATVPQLSTNNMMCSVCSLTRRRLYVLLSDGTIHIWQLHPKPGAAPAFLSAWTHLQREQCICMTLLEAGSLAIPKSLPLTDYGTVAKGALIPLNADALEQRVCAVISNLVLGLDHNSGCVAEHLVFGSLQGDILVVDADRGGNIVCRIPGFKHQGGVTRVALACSGPGIRRPWQDSMGGSPSGTAEKGWDDNGRQEDPIIVLVVTSRNFLKVWDFELGLRFVHAAETSHMITCLEVCGSRAFVGTTTGSVHILDLQTGRPLASSSSLDHMDCVTAISPCAQLQHLVTAAKDSHIKVFNFRKALKRSMYVGCPVSAVSFLNTDGDILMAISKRLVIVKSHMYAFTLHESESGHVQRKESIFEGVPMLDQARRQPPPKWQDYFLVFVPPPPPDGISHRPSMTGSERRPPRRSSSSVGGKTPRLSYSGQVLEGILSRGEADESNRQANEAGEDDRQKNEAGKHNRQASEAVEGNRQTKSVAADKTDKKEGPLDWQDDPLWFIRSKGKQSPVSEEAPEEKLRREQKRKTLEAIAKSHPYLQPALIVHQGKPGAPFQGNIKTGSRLRSMSSRVARSSSGLSAIPEKHQQLQWQEGNTLGQQNELHKQRSSTRRRSNGGVKQQQRRASNNDALREQQSGASRQAGGEAEGQVKHSIKYPQLNQKHAEQQQQQQQQQGVDDTQMGIRKPPPPSGIPLKRIKVPNANAAKDPGPGGQERLDAATTGAIPALQHLSSTQHAAAGEREQGTAANILSHRSKSLPPSLPRPHRPSLTAATARAHARLHTAASAHTGLHTAATAHTELHTAASAHTGLHTAATAHTELHTAASSGHNAVQGPLPTAAHGSGSASEQARHQPIMDREQGDVEGEGHSPPPNLMHSRSVVRFSTAAVQEASGLAPRLSGNGTLKGASESLQRHSDWTNFHRDSSSRDSTSTAPSLVQDKGTMQTGATSGASEGSNGDGDSGSSEESEDEEDEKAALKEQRQQQLAYLAQHWRHNELVKIQTYFHVDLVAVELERRSHLLAPEDPSGPVYAPVSSPPHHTSPPAAGATGSPVLQGRAAQAAKAGNQDLAARFEDAGVIMQPSSLFTSSLNVPGTRRADGARGLGGVGESSMASSATVMVQGAGPQSGSRATSAGSMGRGLPTGTGATSLGQAGKLLQHFTSLHRGAGGLSETPKELGLPTFQEEDVKGLAAEFRRALPLLCSQTAFMEGLQSVEEEELIAALRAEFDDAGARKKKRRKGKRRGRRRKEGHGGKADDAASSTIDPIFGGWNKVPPLSSATGAKAADSSSKGGGGEGARKGGKQKRGKGSKNSLKALRAVDTAAYLAKDAHAHSDS